MRTTGIFLILFSFLVLISVTIYKSIKHTLFLIGPKSSAALVICGILIVIGIWIVLRNKNKK
jgi:hypothetical protein